ncbi:Gfo/Idh/MocA family protein [Aspergillus undulatus]|uniref:Gfo/Idh/MocA family protein n=1 Tax=Aspergillus undulatus TaxID=1810928 RepID=UPI003CCDCD82
MKQLSFLIIGAGSRGSAYARAITTSTPARIGAVAEPNHYKRRALGEQYIWGHDQQSKLGEEFSSWEEWIEFETRRRRNTISNGEDAQERGVDGVLICTLDETHITVLNAIAKAGFLDLHILCEKPLALSLDDCLSVYAAWTKPNPSQSEPEKGNKRSRQIPQSIFSIGHVLRYSPHNLTLRRLVREEKAIGDIVSIEHTEPVGHWHFAHSYVRGNWRRETEKGDGSLLTKSCHDVDFLMWLVESPVNTAGARTETAHGAITGDKDERKLSLRSVTSTGHLTQFTRSRKPPGAGTTTNCVSCPTEVERQCMYSAIRIYKDDQLRKGETGWPVNIVCPDIEDYIPQTLSNCNGKHKDIHNGDGEGETSAAEHHLLNTLSQDYDPSTPDSEIKRRPWYGRCVYESDNDVVDDQVVTLAWDDITHSHSPSTSPLPTTTTHHKKNTPGVTAILHMTAPTKSQCVRRGRIYGTKGEIAYTSSTITIHDFTNSTTRVINIPKQPPEEEKAHGGGDYGLARGFVGAVDKVVNGGWTVEDAQRGFVGCDLKEIVKSHGVVFAAEESRRGEEVVKWAGWWEEKLGGFGLEA